MKVRLQSYIFALKFFSYESLKEKENRIFALQLFKLNPEFSRHFENYNFSRFLNRNFIIFRGYFCSLRHYLPSSCVSQSEKSTPPGTASFSPESCRPPRDLCLPKFRPRRPWRRPPWWCPPSPLASAKSRTAGTQIWNIGKNSIVIEYRKNMKHFSLDICSTKASTIVSNKVVN